MERFHPLADDLLLLFSENLLCKCKTHKDVIAKLLPVGQYNFQPTIFLNQKDKLLEGLIGLLGRRVILVRFGLQILEL